MPSGANARARIRGELQAGSVSAGKLQVGLGDHATSPGTVLTATDNFGNASWQDPHPPGTLMFGGMYTIANSGGCATPNPSTFGCSCPSGFSEQMLILESTEPLEAASRNLYYCYR